MPLSLLASCVLVLRWLSLPEPPFLICNDSSNLSDTNFAGIKGRKMTKSSETSVPGWGRQVVLISDSQWCNQNPACSPTPRYLVFR